MKKEARKLMRESSYCKYIDLDMDEALIVLKVLASNNVYDANNTMVLTEKFLSNQIMLGEAIGNIVYSW